MIMKDFLKNHIKKTNDKKWFFILLHTQSLQIIKILE